MWNDLKHDIASMRNRVHYSHRSDVTSHALQAAVSQQASICVADGKARGLELHRTGFHATGWRTHSPTWALADRDDEK
jgi:hypothetical protein